MAATRSKEPGARTWVSRKAMLPPYAPPRLADGRPDFQGPWGGGATGDDIEDHDYVDVTTPAMESWVADPADGKIPYQPWALAERNRHRAAGISGHGGRN